MILCVGGNCVEGWNKDFNSICNNRFHYAVATVYLNKVLSWLAGCWIVIIALSITAGTDIRRLWWIPLTISALFPLLFGIAISDFVWDLYFYSAIYLPIGILAMLGTHFGVKHSRKGEKGL